VDGVSLISFVKYLEHQEWKGRMRKWKQMKKPGQEPPS
jgi:hypothetical protein